MIAGAFPCQHRFIDGLFNKKVGLKTENKGFKWEKVGLKSLIFAYEFSFLRDDNVLFRFST